MSSYYQARPSFHPRFFTSGPPSHQTGVIKEHWNDIPAQFTPSSSRSASRNVSRTGTPLPFKAPRTPPMSAGSDAAAGGGFDDLITTLLSLPTYAPPAESRILTSRIQKNLGGITAEQRLELAEIIRAVIIDRVETPAWGREQIVDFMMREKGIASWASAIRRTVECVRLE